MPQFLPHYLVRRGGRQVRARPVYGSKKCRRFTSTANVTRSPVALGDAEALDDVAVEDGELLLHAASVVAAARVVMPTGRTGRVYFFSSGTPFLTGG